ncbi:MAG: hypothetical protein KDK78_07550 [Chlamydiia bacterium]|nr:hypothetical protein [Chlamydiia bacterium]
MAKKVALRDWAKEISKVLFDCAKAPTTGTAAPFPWQELSAALARTFAIEGLSITLASMRWAEPDEFLSGIGRKPQVQALRFSPLQGSAHWIIAEGELKSLMGWLVTKEKSKLQLPEKAMEDAFYTFLCLETLHTLDAHAFFKGCTPTMSDGDSLPREAGLLVDANVSIGGHKIATRVLISPELYKDWMKTHAAADASGSIPDDLADSIEAILHVEIGKTRLGFEEWGSVKTGDCLLLDTCSAKPGDTSFPVTLSVGGVPLWRGLVQNGQLAIQDSIQVREV